MNINYTLTAEEEAAVRFVAEKNRKQKVDEKGKLVFKEGSPVLLPAEPNLYLIDRVRNVLASYVREHKVAK